MCFPEGRGRILKHYTNDLRSLNGVNRAQTEAVINWWRQINAILVSNGSCTPLSSHTIQIPVSQQLNQTNGLLLLVTVISTITLQVSSR